jgi:hypothetical protein
MAIKGIPLGEWSGSDATKALHETIKEFSKASGRQTKWMLGLTWAIAVLTLVMAFGLGVQIWLALKGCA